MVNFPIVLVPGNMGNAAALAASLARRHITAIDAMLGPVSSCHDRACELFYALLGGRVDYGKEHSAHHGHRRFGRYRDAQHPSWSAASPVLLLCHSQGAMAALALLELLADQHFPGYSTSAEWVAGIVCIASPLAGVPTIHTLPLARVPVPCPAPDALPAANSPAPTVGSAGSRHDVELLQPVGTGFVGVVIVCSYVAHVIQAFFTSLLLDTWSATMGETFRAHVWDWRVDHWSLSVADLPALLRRTHRIVQSTDTALHELTPIGAHRRAHGFRMHPAVYYIAMPCQVTAAQGGKSRAGSAEESCGRAATSLPLPSHLASPLHVCVACLTVAFAPRPCCRHSDGLVPTCVQRHPPGQPHRVLAQLSPPRAHRNGSGGRSGRAKDLYAACACCGGAQAADGPGDGSEGGGDGEGGAGAGADGGCGNGAREEEEAPTERDCAMREQEAERQEHEEEELGGSSRRLSECLEPGVWWSGGSAWSVDHGRSMLAEGSPTLEHALECVLPAVCEARARRNGNS